MFEGLFFACCLHYSYILSYFLINDVAYLLLKALFESLICLMKWFHIWNVEPVWITFDRSFSAIFCELMGTFHFHCLTVKLFSNECKSLAVLSLPTVLKFNSLWILKDIHIMSLSRFIFSDNRRNLDRNNMIAISWILQIFRHFKFGIIGKRHSWHGFTQWIEMFKPIIFFNS